MLRGFCLYGLKTHFLKPQLEKLTLIVMDLSRFYCPDSIAVIGTEWTKREPGYGIVASLIRDGYGGAIYPINPNAGKVEGIPAYSNLKSIGGVPKLAVIAVAVNCVKQVVDDCADLGVKAVVIITSGFKESGSHGSAIESSIVRVARSKGMRVIGPNCIGIMMPHCRLNASLAGEMPEPGGIGYFSESASILASIADMARATGLGFSRLFSIGNKADVDELDLIETLGADAETSVIAGYLETIDDGDAFIHRAEKVSREKPILLIKSGVTKAGALAASSHTGRMAGVESTYECVFERAGVIRCDSIRRQFEYARAFASQPLPNGPRVAVIANAGGAGIMAVDAVEREGLVLAECSDETRGFLSNRLCGVAHMHNPIDLLGDALADRYEVALQAVIEDPGVDAVLVVLSPNAMTEPTGTAEAVVRVISRKPAKPVFACFMGAERVKDAVDILRNYQVPQYEIPESAIAAIKAMVGYQRWRSRPKRVVKLFGVNKHKVERIITRQLKNNNTQLAEVYAKEILRAYGFLTPKGQLTTSSEQAVNIAEQVGYPVVMKIWSPQIIHKSEAGGVFVGIDNRSALMDAYDLLMYRIPKRFPTADIIGVYIEKMQTEGDEFILGMNRDPVFGPLLMFGMGGRLVEFLEDIAFYPAPITAGEAKEMLLRTRTYRLLHGTAGQTDKTQALDIDGISEGLQRLSQLVTEFPQIKEVDINPYVVGAYNSPPVAVDAMMTLEKT